MSHLILVPPEPDLYVPPLGNFLPVSTPRPNLRVTGSTFRKEDAFRRWVINIRAVLHTVTVAKIVFNVQSSIDPGFDGSHAQAVRPFEGFTTGGAAQWSE